MKRNTILLIILILVILVASYYFFSQKIDSNITTYDVKPFTYEIDPERDRLFVDAPLITTNSQDAAEFTSTVKSNEYCRAIARYRSSYESLRMRPSFRVIEGACDVEYNSSSKIINKVKYYICLYNEISKDQMLQDEIPKIFNKVYDNCIEEKRYERLQEFLNACKKEASAHANDYVKDECNFYVCLDRTKARLLNLSAEEIDTWNKSYLDHAAWTYGIQWELCMDKNDPQQIIWGNE